MVRRLAPLVLALCVACGGGGGGSKTARTAPMTLASPTIVAGSSIPRQFTCDGEDVSPALNWSGVPKGTASVVLILEDLDRSFLHWLVYDLPPTQRSVDAGYTPGLAAVNDFGKQGYGGPCPPAGEQHRYRFTMLALERRVQVTGQVSGKSLERRLVVAPLGRGDLTATYKRGG